MSYLEMMDEILNKQIKNENIELTYLGSTDFSTVYNDKKYIILAKKRKEINGENIWIKAHELGHCKTNSFVKGGKTEQYSYPVYEMIANISALSSLNLLFLATGKYKNSYIKSIVESYGYPSIVYDWLMLIKKDQFCLKKRYLDKVIKISG